MGGEKKVMSRSGATSSVVPRFDLIPREALVKLANRYELGLAKHGKDNWRKGLGDRDYAINRCTHIIDHASKLLELLEQREPVDDECMDDHIGAILWGGAFLAVAVEHLESNTSEKP